MRAWVRWSLFGSSYTPFFIILLLRVLKTKSGSTHSEPVGLAWTLTAIVLVSNAVLIYLLVLSTNFASQEAGKIVTISSKTSESLNYIVTYIIPFLDFKPAEDLLSLIILLAVIGVLYVNSNLLYTNPMLSFFGYRVYEITIEGYPSPRLVLTRRRRQIGDAITITSLDGGAGDLPEAISREVSP
jgi:hypothetical protein